MVTGLRMEGKGKKSGEICFGNGASGGYGDRRGIMPGDYVQLIGPHLSVPVEALVSGCCRSPTPSEAAVRAMPALPALLTAEVASEEHPRITCRCC